MNKRGKTSLKCLSIIQINLLIVSIIAFSFILNIPNIVGEESIIRNIQTGEATTSSLTPSHGYAGKAYEAIFDTGSTQPPGEYEIFDTKIGEYVPIGSKTGFAVTGILQGAMWAVMVYTTVKMVAGLFGLDDKASNAAAISAATGVFAGKTALTLFGKGGMFNEGYGNLFKTLKPGTFSIGAGIVVAAIVFYFTYKKSSTEIITFDCKPWDAPVGGSSCEKCNQQGDLPCSEYQCRSLGQACQLVNPGTEEEKCVWVNRNDVDFPIITTWEDALPVDYRYNPDNTISPPDYGVKIENTKSTTKCVKAFTPLTFGIITDEPARCKIDYLRKENFDEMQFYFGGSSLFRYNHSQIMSLPGPSALAAENLTIQNDGNYALYTRCQDANGNTNTATFVFKFCVEKGPDTTPPLIVTTDLLNNNPVAYNQTSVDLTVYTNEPASCKWSHLDQTYENMEETMSCSSSVFEMNAQMLYKCTTKLTGLKDRIENKFYFRCEDSSENVNTESYEFNLIGTQPLIIDSVKPNETVRDSTEAVKVIFEAETSAGYNEGESACYLSDTGNADDYVMFYNTNSYKHSQELHLTEGDYKYYIKCVDLGGNYDIKTVEFDVESDSEAPLVTRIYHEETYLKIITNEDSECVYDTTNCNYLFEDGIKLKTTDDLKHFTDWSTKTNFYIKCKDEYDNQPSPNACSIIARPIQISSV